MHDELFTARDSSALFLQLISSKTASKVTLKKKQNIKIFFNVDMYPPELTFCLMDCVLHQPTLWKANINFHKTPLGP